MSIYAFEKRKNVIRKDSVNKTELKKIGSDCCWSGCWTLPIHRRDPATAQHGDFCLLRFRPGPVRPSLDNLVTSSSPDDTILMPGLARTPDRHRTTPGRDPDLKPSTNLRLQVAGLQEHATTPSRQYSFGDLEWWKTLWLWPFTSLFEHLVPCCWVLIWNV